MTEIIKAQSDAELLKLIPQVAGFSAADSIVVAAFGGKRATMAFRVDLPKRQRVTDYRATSSMIVGALQRMPAIDGAAVAIYSTTTFEREGGIPWVDLERHILDRLGREGFGVMGSFCVAPDGWASYFDHDYPREGRPLAEIELDEPLPDIGRWAGLPTVTPAQQCEFLEQIVDVCSGYWPSELEHVSRASPIELIEAILEWRGPLPSVLGVELVQLAQAPARRDVIALQVAFGQIVAEAVEEQNTNYLRVQSTEGGSMDAVVRREVAAGRASRDDEIAGLLMGKGRVRPDVKRVERMIELLRHHIALAPAHDRPGPLCILAYLVWARGLSSAARTHIQLALSIDPRYGMAQLMNTMLNAGMVPEWVFD